MGKFYIKDSGVCFAKKPQAWLFLSSRKLYREFLIPDYNLGIMLRPANLFGCALRRCKFPTLTCDKCSFNY